ncbi:FtsH protease activity modulator HflK [Rhodovulum sp. DZ06]|uniref:FtsH protease activity modulator HflK n=1 Tax=Rhodovulum sp. DZ06 TaxID=3425126 RepID=UPI003D356B09
MPFSNNSGGPWGGGGNKGGGGRGPWGGGSGGGGGGGGQGGGGNGQGPDVDELIRQGRDRLKVIFGGDGNGGGGNGRPGGGEPEGLGRGGWTLLALFGAAAWVWASIYTVAPEERSVELLFGEESGIGEPGLNVAPWPFFTYEKLPVTRENIINIGDAQSTTAFNAGRNGGRPADTGLMLTGDENIVDIDFQVVWNISDPAKFLFNLAEPDATIRAVSESAMREVIGRSELKPILNRDRAIVSQEVQALIQGTLDSYESGVNIVRVNFDKADPPEQVIDAFRDVQAAAQDRDRAEKQAEAYANQRLASARGEAAQLVQEAEAYSARIVNEAEGEAARFVSVYDEYAQAKDVTRKRLYIETMERVLSGVDKIVIDDAISSGGGQGVVPYLPLNELRKSGGAN